MGCKEEIFCRCGGILYPEITTATFYRLVHIATDHYRKRCCLEHLSTRIGSGKGVDDATLIHYDEVPRLLVHRCRSRHCSSEHFFHLLFLHRTGFIGADAGASSDGFEHRFLRTFSLFHRFRARSKAHTEHQCHYCEHHIEYEGFVLHNSITF